MTNNSFDIALKSIPAIQATVDSGIDWAQIGGISLTALAVIASTVITIRTVKGTIKSQEAISSAQNSIEKEKVKIEILSRNRQAWINSLRDETANYIAAVSNLWAVKQIGRESWDTDRYYSALKEAEHLKAKVKLLINPKEDDSIELVELIQQAHTQALTNAENISKQCEKIVSKTQEILKTEWERVKKIE